MATAMITFSDHAVETDGNVHIKIQFQPEIDIENDITPAQHAALKAMTDFVDANDENASSTAPVRETNWLAELSDRAQEIERLRAANQTLAELLGRALNGLNWYQEDFPNTYSEVDDEFLEECREVLGEKDMPS